MRAFTVGLPDHVLVAQLALEVRMSVFRNRTWLAGALLGMSLTCDMLIPRTEAEPLPLSNQPRTKKPADAAEINRLIQQLGSDKFAARRRTSCAVATSHRRIVLS